MRQQVRAGIARSGPALSRWWIRWGEIRGDDLVAGSSRSSTATAGPRAQSPGGVAGVLPHRGRPAHQLPHHLGNDVRLASLH